SCPRATVPGTSGRDARPSGKKVLASRGSYFGWSCMSCLQPAVAHSSKRRAHWRQARELHDPWLLPVCNAWEVSDITIHAKLLVRYFRDSPWLQGLQEATRRTRVKLRVGGFDRNEKSIPYCHLK